MYHNPILLKECIDNLVKNPSGIYIDLTYGGGGHARAILERLNNYGRIIAFDLDEDALANKIDDPRIVFVNQNYRYLWNYLRFYDAIPVDGVLADLGISSHQIDDGSRGFSIRNEGFLDMRMDNRSGITAKDVVNKYPEEKLTKMFRDYGEIDKAYQLSNAIIKQRSIKPIETTSELKEVVEKVAPRNKEYNFVSQVFQAIRIEVNKELESLEEMLIQLSTVVKPGGVIAIISYHSLEDRLVKNLFKTGNIEGEERKDFYGQKLTPFKPLTRKPILPSDVELQNNGRSRSAKLRIAERI
jgi:16S rRNA (cytosine1402-N4)-methyltransferase